MKAIVTFVKKQNCQNDINIKHCGHTTTAIWVSSVISMLSKLCHHVQLLHLIINKCPEML